MEMEEMLNELYDRAAEYAAQNGLENMAKALTFVKELAEKSNPMTQVRRQAALRHGLEVCRMLMDLHLSLSGEDEDTLLAAVMLHTYPEDFPNAELQQEVSVTPAVCELVGRIAQSRDMTDEEQQLFYTRAQSDPLALLAVLADRGIIVQQLHRFSTWNAHRYIEETKACYYPMGIYGKEHYHDLLAPISVLLEKIRTLLSVAEILLRRYESRETELIQDIMALREENAILKGIIAKFKA